MTKTAAIQTHSGDDVAHNLEVARAQLLRAAAAGCELAVLPECFAFMQRNTEQLLDTAEREGDGPIQSFLATISRETGMWIIAGSVPLRTDAPGKVANTLLVHDGGGGLVARYRKLFLFDVTLDDGERYHESAYTLAGDSLEVAATPAGVAGLSICYDIRFPEMFRKLTEMGAEILVAPSAFSHTTGSAHWMPLLQARAIENGCYVVAPAQSGVHNGKRKTWGHTVIIDPWGRVLGELARGVGMIHADVDLARVRECRRGLPTHAHFRPELFR